MVINNKIQKMLWLIKTINFSKLINFAVPDTIDPRAINTGKKLSLFKKHENLTLAITSAKVGFGSRGGMIS